ncbi:DUF4062 domain-containing protein [Leucobacter luti]|uniref:DUF4062 domain-containing protein n=1 Tax=Leucobacter luti TaxID=340320 RepID=UPI001C688814|nr:DUF4062 domain-containing protein [Leucobacter luti]QYM76176.1 DUF4062 domain-containing protein [Leucobacter luti]
MTKKYQIFVSSTYEDLKVERNRVIQGILELGHIPVGMEMFSAGDEEQWKVIARNIEQSDYYVVIVAHRYGSMSGDISYTRKEYEYAVACGVPIIGFVVDPDATWPPAFVDTEAPHTTGLREFKALVTSKLVGFWQNADDLYGQATVALVKAANTNPRTGWVRADAAVGTETVAEMTRLSAENAELRRALKEATTAAIEDRTAHLQAVYDRLSDMEWSHSVRVVGNDEWLEGEPINLRLIFEILSPGMVIEMTKDSISELLVLHASAQANEARVRHVPTNTRDEMLADFMSLDLMQPSSLRHPVSDKNEYWTLTELGQELLKFIRRMELDKAPEAVKSDEDTPF